MIASAMEHRIENTRKLREASCKSQFHGFTEILFSPKDLVEIRAIKSGTDADSRVSPVTLRTWVVANELPSSFEKLADLNRQGSNIYFGVNPRIGRGGKKSDVGSCSVLWADIDDCSVADAKARWQKIEMEPSVVISSGHGVHLYWKLREPLDVSKSEQRMALEQTLKNLYLELDSDSTQDVTRLLRLPGFLNVKGDPVPCSVQSYNADRRYSIDDFAHWKNGPDVYEPSLSLASLPPALSVESVTGVDPKRVRGLLATLDRDTNDRSRRDFWVICQLFRLGLSETEISQLVAGKSKFQTPDYIAQTVSKAAEAIR